MKKRNIYHFGSTLETFVYPLLLLIILWTIFWAEKLFPTIKFHEFGILPRTVEGLKGILLMPLVHAKNEIAHIINNSFPITLFLAALIYFYREIAFKVFVFCWLATGFLVWIYANNKGAYHIGISGIIYALAGFLFTSGVIRKFLPLQAISLFVSFFYGSMIWGVFPMQEKVSWEGHLMGLITGVALAFIYRNEGPLRPKYQYEIEKELGIEPPDLEGIYLENLRIENELQEEQSRQNEITYVYDFIPKSTIIIQKDEND